MQFFFIILLVLENTNSDCSVKYTYYEGFITASFNGDLSGNLNYKDNEDKKEDFKNYDYCVVCSTEIDNFESNQL